MQGFSSSFLKKSGVSPAEALPALRSEAATKFPPSFLFFLFSRRVEVPSSVASAFFALLS